jgi:hypothetical protein
MKSNLECVPCLMRQAIESTNMTMKNIPGN